MERRQKIYWHIILFVFAGIVRILFMGLCGGLDNNIRDSMSDQYIYLDIAGNLIDHGHFVVSTDTWVANAGEMTSIVPPLYPLFLALVFSLFGQDLIIVRLLQVMISASLVNFVFAIAQHASNEKTAILAGILAAIYPGLVMYVRPIMSEGLFYTLIPFLVWATYKLDQANPSKGYFVLWGGIAAFSVLTRTEVMFLIVLLLVYLAYSQLKRTHRINLVGFSVLALTAFIVLSPYIVYNYAAHGKIAFLPNAKWKFWDHTYWTEMRNHPEWEGTLLPEREIVPDWEGLTEVERDDYLWNMAIEFIRSHPDTFLVQRVKHLVWGYPVIPRELFSQSGKPDGFEYGPTSLDDVVRYVTVAEQVRVWVFRSVFFLAVCGIVITLWYRHARAYPLLLVLIWNIFHTMLFVGSERLRLQIDFCLLIFAALFIVHVLSSALGRNRP